MPPPIIEQMIMVEIAAGGMLDPFSRARGFKSQPLTPVHKATGNYRGPPVSFFKRNPCRLPISRPDTASASGGATTMGANQGSACGWDVDY